jgi:ATP-dependent protease HslVU (ClpYQ) peptidase subunit
MGYRASTCAEGARAVEGQVQVLVQRLIEIADRLALARTVESHDRVSIDQLRAAAVDCLRRWRNDESVGHGAIAVVIAGEWAQNIARLEDDIEQPVRDAVAAARLPWWR